MHFIDELRQLGSKLPPSHVPSLNELAGVVGAIVAHAEHGDSILKAAEVGAEEVARVLAPVAADVAEAAIPGAAPIIGAVEQIAEATLPQAPAETQSEADTVAELRKALEAAQTTIANLSRGTVTSEPAPADGSAG